MLIASSSAPETFCSKCDKKATPELTSSKHCGHHYTRKLIFPDFYCHLSLEPRTKSLF